MTRLYSHSASYVTLFTFFSMCSTFWRCQYKTQRFMFPSYNNQNRKHHHSLYNLKQVPMTNIKFVSSVEPGFQVSPLSFELHFIYCIFFIRSSEHRQYFLLRFPEIWVLRTTVASFIALDYLLVPVPCRAKVQRVWAVTPNKWTFLILSMILAWPLINL